jgi:CheY-like chemotaxis protein
VESRRVLAVDDDPAMHRLLEEQLRPLGWHIDTVPDGEAAVRRVREAPYDIVLTGMRTPLDEDLGLAARLRALQPDLNVVVFTPQPAPQSVIAAMREHICASFSAPFDPAEVRDVLVRMLDGCAVRDGIQVLSARPDWVALKVACRLDVAERLLQFMHELHAGLPENVRSRIGIAVREMLLNAMEHGGRFDPNQFIHVDAVRTRRAIVYHFRDPGAGFRGEEVDHAAKPEDPLEHLGRREAKGLRPGGFGILLARQMVDELIYNESGNEVVLIHYLDRPPATG